jgi:transposase
MAESSAGPVPNLIKVRSDRSGRCTYDKAAKRELVRRCLVPGVSLARTALEHGVNANLLRKWVLKQTGMRAPKERKPIGGPSPQVALLEVHTQAAVPIRPVAQATGHLELIVPGGTIRIIGHVDAQALMVVLHCLAHRA